jgi:hypothetical protein
MEIQAKRVTGMSRRLREITKDLPESIKRPCESLRGRTAIEYHGEF